MPAPSRTEKLAIFNAQAALLDSRVTAEQAKLTEIADLESQLSVCTNKVQRQSLQQQIAESQALLLDLDAAVVMTANYLSGIAASIATGGQLLASSS